MSIYKQAIMAKITFKVGNSTVNVSDLFGYPTRSKGNDNNNLNWAFQQINDQLVEAQKPSLDGKTPSTTLLSLKHAIIRDVYQTKLREEAKKKAAIATKAIKNDISRRAFEELSRRTTEDMSRLTTAQLLALT
jgi:hypothetical protein